LHVFLGVVAPGGPIAVHIVNLSLPDWIGGQKVHAVAHRR
jgi:hypothetical protein